MPVGYQKHARRHKQGAEDPIDGLGGPAALYRLYPSTISLTDGDAIDMPFAKVFDSIGLTLSVDKFTLTTPAIGSAPLWGLANNIIIQDPPGGGSYPFTVLHQGGGRASTHTAIEAVPDQGYQYGNNGFETDAGVEFSVQVTQDSGVTLVLDTCDFWVVYLGQYE